MDPGFRSPLVELFRRGDAPRDAMLLAARGLLATRAQEQIALLVLLSDSADAEVATQANATIERLPAATLADFLARPEATAEIRDFFARRGVTPGATPVATSADPMVDTDDLPQIPEGTDEEQARVLANLPVADRLKLAMKGTREQRAQLIRDSNQHRRHGGAEQP